MDEILARNSFIKYRFKLGLVHKSMVSHDGEEDKEVVSVCFACVSLSRQ
jgi:hypothetical protein